MGSGVSLIYCKLGISKSTVVSLWKSFLSRLHRILLCRVASTRTPLLPLLVPTAPTRLREVSNSFGGRLELFSRDFGRRLTSFQVVPLIPGPHVPRREGKREERAEHCDAVPVTSVAPPPGHGAEEPHAMLCAQLSE